MAELRVIGYIADMVGDREMNVSLENPIKLKDILSAEIPEDRCIVLINQRLGNMDSLIRDKDKVLIMPIISGG